LRVKRNEEIALKDGDALRVAHVWEEGETVKIQDWLMDDTFITVTHRGSRSSSSAWAAARTHTRASIG
jgi:hypothetical protein